MDFTSLPALSGVQAGGKSVLQLSKGEIEKAAMSAVESFFVLNGIPYAQPKRILKAIVKGSPKEILWPEKSKTNKPKFQRIGTQSRKKQSVGKKFKRVK